MVSVPLWSVGLLTSRHTMRSTVETVDFRSWGLEGDKMASHIWCFICSLTGQLEKITKSA